MATEVTVGELMRGVDSLLARAEAGETIVILRDGQPTLEMRRVEKTETTTSTD